MDFAGNVSNSGNLTVTGGLTANGNTVLDTSNNSIFMRDTRGSGQRLTATGSTTVTLPASANGQWVSFVVPASPGFTPTTYAATIGTGGCFVSGFALAAPIVPSSGGFSEYIENITGAAQGACGMNINWTAFQ